MVDNDNASFLNARGVLETIASKLAPTVLVKLVANSYNSTHGQRGSPHLAF
jgi:hypothetical protein